jgi:hypothetical protein
MGDLVAAESDVNTMLFTSDVVTFTFVWEE